MDRKRYVLVVFLTLIVFSSIYSTLLYSQKFSSIIIDMYYDVYNNVGYVNQTVILDRISGEPEIVSIPLIKIKEGGRYEIVSIYGDLDGNLTYEMKTNENVLLVLVNRSRTIHIDYLLYNCSTEISVDTYSIPLDLIDYKNTSYLQLNLLISGGFKVFVEPHENVEIQYLDDSVKITVTKPLYYFVLLYTLEEKESSTTTSPNNVLAGLNNYIYLLFASVGIILIGLALFLYRRKEGRVELETLPPSILEDDTTRQIIIITGDAGDKGVKQSELVKLTKRPKSSISRRIKRLVEEGYVMVIRSGKHNIIKLTSKGLDVYRDLKKNEET